MIRKIAKEIIKEQNLSFLDEANYNILEEKLLCAFLIGYAKLPIEEKLVMMRSFIPKIDNWSVCDSFCASFQLKKTEKARVFDFLQPYLHSLEEYQARFGIVMLLDHFIEDEYIDMVLQRIKECECEMFYTQMASAWAISVCMVYFPEKTIKVLEEKSLCTFVQNKGIQKSMESYRINDETKQYIKTLKYRSRV